MDELILDNDRIIKLGNLYTDESINALKTKVYIDFGEIRNKIQTIEGNFDEEIDKVKKLNINWDEFEKV